MPHKDWNLPVYWDRKRFLFNTRWLCGEGIDTATQPLSDNAPLSFPAPAPAPFLSFSLWSPGCSCIIGRQLFSEVKNVYPMSCSNSYSLYYTCYVICDLIYLLQYESIPGEKGPVVRPIVQTAGFITRQVLLFLCLSSHYATLLPQTKQITSTHEEGRTD